MKMNKELKISIPGKLPSASLLLLLSFSLTLLLLCPKPKSTKKKISSALSDVSSLYPLIPSSSFSAGFFYLLFQQTSPAQEKMLLLCWFSLSNRESHWTSSVTPTNLKKMRISFAHNFLQTSYLETSCRETTPQLPKKVSSLLFSL